MIIYKNNYAQIEYQSSYRLIHFIWNQFVPSEKFREIFQALGKEKALGICDKWLLDCRAMRIISPEDQHWLIEDWLENREDCDGRKINVGLLMPDDLFGKLSVERLIRRLNGTHLDFHFHCYEEEKIAREWAYQEVKRLYTETSHIYI